MTQILPQMYIANLFFPLMCPHHSILLMVWPKIMELLHSVNADVFLCVHTF